MIKLCTFYKIDRYIAMIYDTMKEKTMIINYDNSSIYFTSEPNDLVCELLDFYEIETIDKDFCKAMKKEILDSDYHDKEEIIKAFRLLKELNSFY